MARRHNNTGRSKGHGSFVMLDRSLLHSPAYRSLNTQARAVLVELYDRYNGHNNGRIGLSVRSAANLCNIAKDTANKALRSLVDHGFIECVTPGGFSRKTRHAAEWRLTQHPCHVTGAKPTKTYMKWGREKNTRSQTAAAPVINGDHSPPHTIPSGPELGRSCRIPATESVPPNGTHIESSQTAVALGTKGGPPPSKQGGPTRDMPQRRKGNPTKPLNRVTPTPLSNGINGPTAHRPCSEFAN